MELANFLRTVVLYVSSLNPNSLFIKESNTFQNQNSELNDLQSFATTSFPTTNVPDADINNCTDENSPSTALMPYDFDCAMPYPPQVITSDSPSSFAADSNKPQQQNEHEVQPHAKAMISVPLHIVHRLPDSAIIDLHRFIDYCEDKIFDCYSAIKDFNNYNYEKNQEIQYLSYTEKRKQEIIEQSKEKKSKIEETYHKMHQVCMRGERQREKITKVLNPYVGAYARYFAQPKRIPKVWYDIYNLETVVQQLFTPKLRTRSHYDETNHMIRMSRMPITDSEQKVFKPLTKEYLSSKYGDDDDETVDGASIIMENNHPDTAIEIQTKQTSAAEQFNNNVLEQYTYSSNKDIQQIIMYYVYKFYELKVRDGTRKVFHFTRLLKEKKRSGGEQTEISNLEDRVADAVKELQFNTIEMERNRVIPELIGVYNAENAAHDVLPTTKYSTKLIGTDNKRVITAFNPAELIEFNALSEKKKKIQQIVADATTNGNDRQDLDEPLYWDQNWEWDF